MGRAGEAPPVPRDGPGGVRGGVDAALAARRAGGAAAQPVGEARPARRRALHVRPGADCGRGYDVEPAPLARHPAAPGRRAALQRRCALLREARRARAGRAHAGEHLRRQRGPSWFVRDAAALRAHGGFLLHGGELRLPGLRALLARVLGRVWGRFRRKFVFKAHRRGAFAGYLLIVSAD